jgi:hypothetical protein
MGLRTTARADALWLWALLCLTVLAVAMLLDLML